MSYNIAIDGPAGAGKSTIAKAVAKRKGYIYVDTGALYRAMGLYMLRKGIDASDTEKVCQMCEQAHVTIAYEDGQQVVYLNGENVNDKIRREEVGNMASAISPIPGVRKKLLELQKTLAEENDCVMDGRDIGTCVLPGAQCKIYLTASSEVRARRRFLELEEKGIPGDFDKIKADIEERDYRDMHREVSPLCQAEDATLVDSSDMTIQQVIDRILELSKV